MGKFGVIDTKEHSFVIVGSKAELGRIVGVSVPTVSKWFSMDKVFFFGRWIIGYTDNSKPNKEK